MSEYEYTVIFGENPMVSSRFETVTAGNEKAATVLAQAEQIKKGNRFDDVYRVDIKLLGPGLDTVDTDTIDRSADIARHGLTGE